MKLTKMARCAGCGGTMAQGQNATQDGTGLLCDACAASGERRAAVVVSATRACKMCRNDQDPLDALGRCEACAERQDS